MRAPLARTCAAATLLVAGLTLLVAAAPVTRPASRTAVPTPVRPVARAATVPATRPVARAATVPATRPTARAATVPATRPAVAVAATAPSTRPISLAAVPPAASFKKGDAVALRVTAAFAARPARDVTAKSAYRSTDAAVATVDATGRIVARGFGQCDIVVAHDLRFTTVRVVVPRPLAGPFPAVKANNKIDDLVHAKLRELGLPPSEPCSDAVFVRRIHLDTTGLLPTTRQAAAFLADPAPDKRAKLIDRLLDGPEFTDFVALKWGDLLRLKAEYPVRIWPKAVQAYHRWLRDAIAANMPYDQFATELLVSSGSNFRDGPANFYRAVPTKDPQTIAETTALLFMGARLSCARCHDDPNTGLTNDDGLAMAAFFAGVRYKSTGEWKEEIVYTDPDATFRHPKTKQLIAPRFLNGAAPTIAPGQDARAVFAQWLTAPGNPWFARNAVNRMWGWTLGRALVEEADDLRPTNPATNPQLLDYLAGELVASKYDVRHVYRLMLNSATYQRSARPTELNAGDEMHYSHYPARRLSAEQLLDALNQVAETNDTYSSIIPEPYTKLPKDQMATRLSDGSITLPFLELFGRPPRDTPYESDRCATTSMRQALHMLNSGDIERKVTSGARIARLIKEGRTDAQIVDDLYLAALSRPPTQQERETVLAYAKGKTPRTRPLQDALWALLNTKEFLFNH